jgi:hypothetical protein
VITVSVAALAVLAAAFLGLAALAVWWFTTDAYHRGWRDCTAETRRLREADRVRRREHSRRIAAATYLCNPPTVAVTRPLAATAEFPSPPQLADPTEHHTHHPEAATP